MSFAERALYHQIHPAKLFADTATALVAIDLFWRHALVPGLIIALTYANNKKDTVEAEDVQQGPDGATFRDANNEVVDGDPKGPIPKHQAH